MDAIDIISNIYKKELAEANQKKIVALTQCDLYKQRIKQLEGELQELKDTTTK